MQALRRGHRREGVVGLQWLSIHEKSVVRCDEVMGKKGTDPFGDFWEFREVLQRLRMPWGKAQGVRPPGGRESGTGLLSIHLPAPSCIQGAGLWKQHDNLHPGQHVGHLYMSCQRAEGIPDGELRHHLEIPGSNLSRRFRPLHSRSRRRRGPRATRQRAANPANLPHRQHPSRTYRRRGGVGPYRISNHRQHPCPHAETHGRLYRARH